MAEKKIEKSKKPCAILWSKIFIIAVIVVIGLTTVGQIINKYRGACNHALEIICQCNLSVLRSSLRDYQIDNDGLWPINNNWCDLIKPSLDEKDDEEYMKCPKDKIGPCSYAMNENIPDDATELPDDMVLLFESTPGWNQIGGSDDVITDRHKRPGASITFANGDIEFVKPEDIPNLRWTVGEE